ncbi:hypothetical protein ACT5EH_001248 [Campylobacter upsaliensis]
MENLEFLLSKERLNHYNNNIDEHFANLRLIGKLTAKIATLEIVLRNMLDYELSKNDKEWIGNSQDNKIIEARIKILNTSGKESLTHHQYLSRLSLGVIVYLIKKEKLQNQIINLKTMKFKKYDKSNKDYFFFENGKRSFFNNINKANIVLSLLHTLRNRSYHWENILKLRYENNIVFPRITTTIKGIL